MLNRIEKINSEMAIMMAKYKEAYRKSKSTEGIEKELCQREMDRCTQRLLELLNEKRKLKEA